MDGNHNTNAGFASSKTVIDKTDPFTTSKIFPSAEYDSSLYHADGWSGND